MLVSRRSAIGAALSFPFINVLASDAFVSGDASREDGSEKSFWERPRWVWLKRVATGEQIKVVYWKDGQLLPQAYADISWLLRDIRFEMMLANGDARIKRALDTGIITPAHLSPWMLMDPVLLDILYAYSAWLAYHNVRSPVWMTSGFRHIITNSLTEGAAFDGWHTKGGAGDIVVPSVRPMAVASFGKWLAAGGVGLYTHKNFTHIDRGRVRSWVS